MEKWIHIRLQLICLLGMTIGLFFGTGYDAGGYSYDSVGDVEVALEKGKSSFAQPSIIPFQKAVFLGKTPFFCFRQITSPFTFRILNPVSGFRDVHHHSSWMMQWLLQSTSSGCIPEMTGLFPLIKG